METDITFDAGIEPRQVEIRAAPEITDFSKTSGAPARLVPASASYFTTSPVFNDQILRLTNVLAQHGHLPTVPPEQAPNILFMTLLQFRSALAERVGAAKYARVVRFLRRLNLIQPRLRPASVQQILEEFRRPGSEAAQLAKPKTIDQYGRAKGVGRRKEAVARVQLIEGNGEIIINGKNIAQVFPRLHDRESVIWPLKITDRLDKYNVFILASGGGISGQAESVTLGLANALMVHEPALKPVLRKGNVFNPMYTTVTNIFSWLCYTNNEACGT